MPKFRIVYLLAILFSVFISIAAAHHEGGGSPSTGNVVSQINPTPLADILPVILGLVIFIGAGYGIYTVYNKKNKRTFVRIND